MSTITRAYPSTDTASSTYQPVLDDTIRQFLGAMASLHAQLSMKPLRPSRNPDCSDNTADQNEQGSQPLPMTESTDPRHISHARATDSVTDAAVGHVIQPIVQPDSKGTADISSTFSRPGKDQLYTSHMAEANEAILRSSLPRSDKLGEDASSADRARYIHMLLNTMQTPRSKYDYLPSLIPTSANIEKSINESFEQNLAGPQLNADGSYDTVLTVKFLRHGQAMHNIGIETGPDAALTDRGIEQAIDQGKALQATITAGKASSADLYISSDLSRCVHTLDHLRAGLDPSDAEIPRFIMPCFQEKPSSRTQSRAQSSRDPSVPFEFEGPFLNGGSTKGTQSPWENVLCESMPHLRNRCYENVGVLAQIGTGLTRRTGKTDQTILISGHEGTGQYLWDAFRQIGGKSKGTVNCKFSNAEIKTLRIHLRTAKDGTVSLASQNDDSVTFGDSLVAPEFADLHERQEEKARKADAEWQRAKSGHKTMLTHVGSCPEIDTKQADNSLLST